MRAHTVDGNRGCRVYLSGPERRSASGGTDADDGTKRGRRAAHGNRRPPNNAEERAAALIEGRARVRLSPVPRGRGSHFGPYSADGQRVPPTSLRPTATGR